MMWLAWLGLAQAVQPDALRLERAVVRDGGRAGEVLLLWPRVIPHSPDREVDGAAAALQVRLGQVVDRVEPLAPRRVAPRGQRVCPRATGCAALTVGALLLHDGGGCAAVGLVGRPGGGPVELVPLAGDLTLERTRLRSRAHPEDVVTVRELVPCRVLVQNLVEVPLVEALRRALR